MKSSRRLAFIVTGAMVAMWAVATPAQETALPDSAKITKNRQGDITAIQIVGENAQRRSSLTPAAIDAIAKFEHLEFLQLWGVSVGDEDVQRLKGLAKLQMIDLAFTDVTGKSLRTLSSLKNLQSVRLEGCDVKDEHLAALADMPRLAMLYLGRTHVTDEGLEHIRELKQLNLLQLSDCAITDAGLASLGDLPVIQFLWLSKTIRYGDDDRSDLTDGCVDYLITLDTLIDLQIADSRLTDGGLQRLREGLPKTKVRTERIGITYRNAK